MQKMSLQEIEQWMTYYYQYPQPESVPLAIESLSKEGGFREENAIEQIMFFLSFIFRANPDNVVEWTSPFIADLPLMEKEMIITSLWLSDTQTAKDYLGLLATTTPEVQQYINDLTAESPPDVEQMPVDNPGSLDVLWAAFMATGEEKYVIRIISALADCDDKDDAIKQLIGNTAKWSLKSNAESHATVKSTCMAQLAEQPPDVVAILQEIIEGGKE